MNGKKIVGISFTLVNLLISTSIYAQDNTLKIRKNCETVEIKIMEQKNVPEGYEILGEGIVKIHGTIAKVMD